MTLKPIKNFKPSLAHYGMYPCFSFKYTPSVADSAKNFLRQSLINAKMQIEQHILVTEDEPLGFRIIDHEFFARYGYTWFYRVDEGGTDYSLFALAAQIRLVTMDKIRQWRLMFDLNSCTTKKNRT